ncbi:hypothetical protein [Brevibacterium litoralis]|uniref:hypothetical protein n=1 Tax=Brevibacterium litoralis TaxID=3138935 RepID=UPI0032F0014A
MDAHIDIAGHLSRLWACVGCNTDDVRLLDAMLTVGEAPVDDADHPTDWLFLNSGIVFGISGSRLDRIDINFVYDRAGRLNGVVVPSWLVEDWRERPDRETVRHTFSRHCELEFASGPVPEAPPRPGAPPPRDVFLTSGVAVTVPYGRDGRAMSMNLAPTA